MAKTKSKTQVPKVVQNHAFDAAEYMKAKPIPLTGASRSGKGGVAIIGEKGPEFVKNRSGKVTLAKVTNHPPTKAEKKAGVARKPDIEEYNLATGVVLKKLEKKAVPISKALQSFKIKTADDYKRKVTQTKLLKSLLKEAEALELTIRKPLKDADRAASALFKPFYESIALIERQVKQEMLEYDEVQSKKLSLLDAKFESTGMSVGSYTKKAAEATAHAGGTLRTLKVLEITDAKKIPREYLMPDEVAIRKALLEGKEVPGACIVEKKSAAI